MPSSEKTPLVGSKGNDSSPKDIRARITDIRQLMQGTHNSRENFSYEWRMDQLNRLEKMFHNHHEEMTKVLHEDLGKVWAEAAVFELMALEAEISYLKKNLKRWMQPEDRPSMALIIPAFSKLTPLPKKGPAVLVIGPSNYPISITLMAFAGSIAAGNPTVLKPSELCPSSSKLLAKYIPDYFEPNVCQVVQGSVPETTALLEYDWGLIHFTGSERVGKIVASAAAKTLTPVILELGGKCPCVIDETCPSDLKQVATRLVWGKLVNCGQNCVSPDYLLVHKSKLEALLPELTRALDAQLGKDVESSPLPKLVAGTHVKRAVELLQEVEGHAEKDKRIEILCGGSKKCDISKGLVAPTFILNPPMDSRLMKEELFAPILPIFSVESREEAVEFINSIPGTPLAFYAFTDSDRVFTDMTESCRSGTAVRNDCLVQFGGPTLPFGGLGTSGMGSYRGEFSFQAFSHMLPTIYRPVFPGSDMNNVRCHPIVPWKRWFILKVGSKLPEIPVLKNARRAATVAIVAVAIARFVPGADVLVQTGRHRLADALQYVVNALR